MGHSVSGGSVTGVRDAAFAATSFGKRFAIAPAARTTASGVTGVSATMGHSVSGGSVNGVCAAVHTLSALGLSTEFWACAPRTTSVPTTARTTQRAITQRATTRPSQ